jgi:pilus assembly protein Flp/PilA
MYRKFRQFLNDQVGVAAVEYGLIAALVAVVIIGAVTTLGTNLSAKFTTIANKLS